MNLDKFLPRELVDKVFENTNIRIVQELYPNNEYLLKKFEKYDLDKIISYTKQNDSTTYCLDNTNYNHKDTLLANVNYTLTRGKIPCLYRISTDRIILTINCSEYIYFNDLELHGSLENIENIEYISLEIGGAEMTRI